uniref:Protein kinase domain-containing protein n=1 Tax=Heterorhabditis bacteriophora TaxID=37862 RepID=A0A1I7WSR1_HETBA
MPRSNNPEESKRIIMDLVIISRSYDCPHIVHSYGYLISEQQNYYWLILDIPFILYLNICSGRHS